MTPAFATEADLCAAFIAALPKGWTAYPETAGFDIVLARAEDGFQIGVEAKLKLNAKVICQVAESTQYHSVCMDGPDCRAVLIPDGVSTDLAGVCGLLGITVIRLRPPPNYGMWVHPRLPELKDGYWSHDWHECAPEKRIKLPDYVPDVVAGRSAPVALTHWKIGAIKLVITLEKRGFLTRKDFEFFKVSMSRWTQGGWIVQSSRGQWIAGRLPDLRKQHPTNFAQIEADYSKWRNPANPVLEKQEPML